MKNRVILALNEWLESKEPINSSIPVPDVLEDDFEKSFDTILQQTTVMKCSIEKGIYFIDMDHSGVRQGVGTSPLEVIPKISLALRRFYKRHGVIVNKKQIHIMYSGNGCSIQIALNNYGLKKIKHLNIEQARSLRQRAGH